jgi:small membrane protein
MEVIQWAILIFTVFAFSRVFINIKSRNLSKLEAIFWLLFWALAILATLFPEFIVWISAISGVERGVDLVVYSTMILLAYLIFRLYAKLRHTEKNITKIIRTIAIKK